MSQKALPGYFIDKSGETRKDRRVNKDRRGPTTGVDRDRRRMSRRQDDLNTLEREHEADMREALAEISHMDVPVTSTG